MSFYTKFTKVKKQNRFSTMQFVSYTQYDVRFDKMTFSPLMSHGFSESINILQQKASYM